MSSCFSGDIVREDAISRRRRKQAFRYEGGIPTIAAFCFHWFFCSPTLFPRVRQRLPLRVAMSNRSLKKTIQPQMNADKIKFLAEIAESRRENHNSNSLFSICVNRRLSAANSVLAFFSSLLKQACQQQANRNFSIWSAPMPDSLRRAPFWFARTEPGPHQ
jgi:hypothetical protein